MKRIFSPYRICPIGAHIDHQGGAVLGRTIRLGTTLDYEALETNEIHLVSDKLGAVQFRIGELDTTHWSRYAQAAARLLKVERGMRAHLHGPLIGAGLSSSASVGLAYLKALADVNDMEVTTDQLVQLEYRLEHDELDLQIGLLDPLTIAYGRRDALLFMDTITASVSPIPDPPSGDFAWIVAYSGISRELTKSGYNVRVAECYEAASLLKDGARILSEVPRAVFEEKKMSLPENLRKRAEHFFTEVERVHQGAQAWKEANLELFGQLMNQSCESSRHNYETGIDILFELHELANSTQGVYGSRFSGGGYGGCVVALAKRELAEDACIDIAERFEHLYPELPARVFTVDTYDGLNSSPVTRNSSPVTRNSSPVTHHSSPVTRHPSSAILLAAGRGKRQRPYTDVLPKPLLEVHGRATIDYILRAVARAGVRRVCIVTHYLEEKIFEYVGDGSKWNLAVTFAHQNELRGNGDAMMSVPKGWRRDEPVMVVATDYILAEESLLELVEAYERCQAEIIMSLKECRADELAVRSSVEVDSEWRVKKIVEKPKPEEVLSPYAASVMFVFPPAIWQYLPKIQPSERGEIELQSAVDMMIQDGFHAYGLLQDAPAEWSDKNI